MGGKRSISAHFHPSLYHSGTAYIFVLFFLSSYLILVGLLERNGRGLILLWGTECYGALLAWSVSSHPGRTAFSLLVTCLSRLRKHLECWVVGNDMIRIS